jgi:hypothetical protein
MQIYVKNAAKTPIVDYASPVDLFATVLGFLALIHACITCVFLIMSVSTDVVYEFNFIASKSAHVFLPFVVALYSPVLRQKPQLEVTRKGDYLTFFMVLAMCVTFVLLVLDCVFFGKDTVPVIIDCYDDDLEVPPINCSTGEERLTYTIGVGLKSAHIVLEALLLFCILLSRYTVKGDSLYSEAPEPMSELSKTR